MTGSNRFVRQVIFPILAAFIWGSAFVAQDLVGTNIGVFTFNALRSIIAVIFLLIVIFFRQKMPQARIVFNKASIHELIKGGLLCGICLTLAANFQHAGIVNGTEAGKAGFITALYVVLVPVIGVFFHRKNDLKIWFSAVLAIIGLYLLCVTNSISSVRASDLLCLVCAIFYTLQILSIDKYTATVDGMILSCAQLFVCFTLSGIMALITEIISINGIVHCLLPILYCGIFSSGIAYTLQILAQKDANPAVVSLLLSLESVFSVICGAIILKTQMSGKEYIGCIIMFIAVILSQIPSNNSNQSEVV